MKKLFQLILFILFIIDCYSQKTSRNSNSQKAQNNAIDNTYIDYQNISRRYSVFDSFPYHFENDSTNQKPTNDLPIDILFSLPHDFQLANTLGYLTTIIFPEGDIWVKSNNGFVSKKEMNTGKNLKNKYEELKKLGYNVYQPIPFPHVLCAYPDIDLIENFEKEAAIDLLKSLVFIQKKDSLTNKLTNDINEIVDNISNNSQSIIIINNQILREEKEQSDLISKIENLENKINNVNQDITNQQKVLNDLQNHLTNIAKKNTDYYDLYALTDIKDAKIEFNYDFLIPIHQKYEIDIIKKDYNTSNTSINGSHFLDKEMVEALDNLNNVLKDPQKYLSTRTDFTNAEIKTLQEWSSVQMKIVSATRSPIDQMKIVNSQKAGTLDSKHLIGVAIDFEFKNMPYSHKIPNNLNNYNLFVKVAKSVGLHFPLQGNDIEGNHAILSSYQNNRFRNTSKYCQKLNTFLEGYYSNIQVEISKRLTEIKSKGTTKKAILDKLSNLESQIKEKQSRLNEIETKLDELNIKYNLKDKELANLSNLFCSLVSREKELRQAIEQKERAIRNRDREYDRTSRDGRPDRPDRTDRQREAPEQDRQRPEPSRESPRPEPRERTREPRQNDYGPPTVDSRRLG